MNWSVMNVVYCEWVCYEYYVTNTSGLKGNRKQHECN